MSGNKKATPAVRIAYCRSRFLRINTVPLCPSHGYKEVVSFPTGLLTCVSDGSLSAFSGINPMTDFRQRQATSTLTAPAARGLTPHSLLSLAVINTSCPATGNIFNYNKKRLCGCSNIKEHHHNHSKSNILTTQ